jgi:hypothetical protein
MIGEDMALPAPRTMPVASWWSVERFLYGIALVLGLWLRVWMLGAYPLSPWEASNSWPAWLAANALSVVDAPLPNSALYYGLQWLLFGIGVNSDGGARFISAIAGAALIVLPWWWRPFLGRRVALIFAWLLALDPWLLEFSRLADGSSLALLCGMVTLVGVTRVAMGGSASKAMPRSDQWQRITAAAVGLLLVSGPMGWNFLPVVAWWGWLLRQELAAAGLWNQRWLPWVGGAVILGATAGLLRLEGVSWIASGVTVWLSQFDGNRGGALLPQLTGGYDLGWPWLRLWVDAAPILLMGVGGLVVVALRFWDNQVRPATDASISRLVLPLCAGWLLWGIVLFLLPGRSPLALPMVGVPLALLSAYWLDMLIASTPRDLDWREAGAVVITLLILLVSGIFWLIALLANPSFDPVLAQATLVIFGLGLAILVAFALWANRRDAAWVTATFLVVVLSLVYVRSGWRLNFANMLIQPTGWQAIIAHPEVRLLAEDMETLSAHQAGDPHELPVQVQMSAYVSANDQVVPARPDPVLGWELRNMRSLSWVTSPSVKSDELPLPLVVTPVSSEGDAVQLDLPSNYAGSVYHVDTWWLPQSLAEENPAPSGEGAGNFVQLWTARLQPWWRWTVYGETTQAPRNRDVILWAPLGETAAQ